MEVIPCRLSEINLGYNFQNVYVCIVPVFTQHFKHTVCIHVSYQATRFFTLHTRDRSYTHRTFKDKVAVTPHQCGSHSPQYKHKRPHSTLPLIRIRQHRGLWAKKQDSLTCPVDLDLVKDPVTMPCGHTYSLGCINICWDQDGEGIYSCPLYR